VTADEQASNAMGPAASRAWAERLQRYCDRMDSAFTFASERREAASGRLAEARRDGDPDEISAAHAALEHAANACHTSTAARERGREALRTALDTLAATTTTGELAVSATTGRTQGGETQSSGKQSSGTQDSTTHAARPGLSIRQAPNGKAVGAARLAPWHLGRLRARRTTDPGQP
jgi:hypothetical protein